MNNHQHSLLWKNHISKTNTAKNKTTTSANTQKEILNNQDTDDLKVIQLIQLQIKRRKKRI
uniref:CSON003469 protein n=1 Tax=Culicoides sonorensis TaxID=179676 RepID=A0A336MNZ7_CULSO